MVGYVGQTEIYNKRKHLEAMIGSLLWWLTLLPVAVLASLQTETAVHLSLRHADGTAVVGETVVLERLPEGEAVLPDCTTDTTGHCTWYVKRGLYQLFFTRPLDNISTLAVAEGGLRGLGITVGDEAITYHFTFHSDDRVYFDTAPNADRPAPLIPTADAWHGGVILTPTPTEPSAITTMPVTVTAPSEPPPALDTAVANTSPNTWRLLLFIIAGLIIGSVFHWWSRYHQQTPNRKSSIVNRKSEKPHA